jgi:hypothetical protein
MSQVKNSATGMVLDIPSDQIPFMSSQWSVVGSQPATSSGSQTTSSPPPPPPPPPQTTPPPPQIPMANTITPPAAAATGTAGNNTEIKWAAPLLGTTEEKSRQRQSIIDLLQKDSKIWNATDWKNWNYATNNSPVPSKTIPQSPVTGRAEPGMISPEGVVKKATLVGPGGDRVEVEVGSQSAQDLFGKGYKLETKAPSVDSTGKAVPGETVTAQNDFIAQLHTIKAEIAKSRMPTEQEQALQSSIDSIIALQGNLGVSTELGVNAIKDQPIAMKFLTGQEAALRRQATTQMAALTNQTLPLKQRLAFEQARRQASVETGLSAYEFAKEEYDVRKGVTTKDELLSVDEARALGLPYGTTKKQAALLGKVPTYKGSGSGTGSDGLTSQDQTVMNAVNKDVADIILQMDSGKMSWANAFNKIKK